MSEYRLYTVCGYIVATETTPAKKYVVAFDCWDEDRAQARLEQHRRHFPDDHYHIETSVLDDRDESPAEIEAMHYCPRNFGRDNAMPVSPYEAERLQSEVAMREMYRHLQRLGCHSTESYDTPGRLSLSYNHEELHFTVCGPKNPETLGHPVLVSRLYSRKSDNDVLSVLKNLSDNAGTENVLAALEPIPIFIPEWQRKLKRQAERRRKKGLH